MKKLLLALFVVLASTWFAPVVFVSSTIAVMKIACLLQQCERDITGDSPAPMFHVMVRLPTEGDRIDSVLFADLNQYIERHPDSTLLLPLEKAVTNTGAWEYSAASEKPGVQIIEARTNDGARIDVRYRAFHHSAQPLSLKVVSQGILFISMPIAGVFTRIFLSLAWRIRRKLQNHQPNDCHL